MIEVLLSTNDIRRAIWSALVVLLVISPASLAAQNKRYSQKPAPNQTSRNPGPGQTPGQPQLAEPGATSTSPLALPFKRTWQHLTDGALAVAPTLDGTRVLLPIEGGQVLCLDRQTGTLLWSSELGGVITSSPVLTENSVLVATRKIREDGSDAGAAIRALDRTTGLTLWVHDYPRSFTSPLTVGGEHAFVGCSDGAFYALSIPGGEIAWKVETQDKVRGQALVTTEAIYFGGDDGAMRAIEPSSGSVKWSIQTSSAVGSRPVSDDRYLYFGAGDGYFYAVNKATGLIKWKSRTGAAIEAPPVLLGERLLVASFDNFIYCLSRATGDRIWKRRLENRITAAPLVQGDANLVAPLHSDYIAVFLNSDGRRVNIFQLEEGFEIIAAPLFAGDTLLIPTSNGLVAATAIKPTEPPTAANKK